MDELHKHNAGQKATGKKSTYYKISFIYSSKNKHISAGMLEARTVVNFGVSRREYTRCFRVLVMLFLIWVLHNLDLHNRFVKIY